MNRLVVASLVGACLGAACARLEAPGPGYPRAAARGALRVQGPARRAVVVGPASFRAYAAAAGGTMYLVPALSGTDADCASILAEAPLATARVPRDRSFLIAVPAQQVACLAPEPGGVIDLVWPVDERPDTGVAVAQPALR